MSLRRMRNLKKSHKCEMWRGENRGVPFKNGKACTLCLKHNSRPLYLSEKYFTVRYDTITDVNPSEALYGDRLITRYSVVKLTGRLKSRKNRWAKTTTKGIKKWQSFVYKFCFQH